MHYISWLLAALLLYGYQTRAQTLFGSVQSVTTYQSCAVSPLGSPPQSSGSPDTDFQSPCSQIGASQTVTEVRMNVFPNRVAGEDNLIFSTTFQPKHTNQASVGGEYDINQVCGGVPVGGNCSVLNQDLVITVESTALYAKYNLKHRKYNIPYSYQVDVCQTDQDQDTDEPFFTVGNQDCNPQAAMQNQCFELENNAPGTNGQNTVQSACPDDGNDFYTPGGHDTLRSQECTTLFCRTQQDNAAGQPWISINTQGAKPTCSIFDIAQRPLGLMNVRVTVNNGTNSQNIVLSTTQGGSIQAVPNQLYARINRINTGVGQIGNVLGGLIVTCIPDADATGNQANVAAGLLNDASGTVNDGFSIANPWSAQACSQNTCPAGSAGYQNCNLPAATCRRNIDADYPNSWWYYVPDEFISQYGLGCNQNGLVGQTLYSDKAVDFQVCGAASTCEKGDFDSDGTVETDCSRGAGTCIPGFREDFANVLRPSADVITPCQVSKQWSNMLAQYTQFDFSQGYFWMPDGFDPASPAFWLEGAELRTNALGGQSDEVSVDLSIYIVGEFLGEIQTASTGEFESTGQFCSAAMGGSGSAAASVRNTGASPGNFLVSASFSSTDGMASFTIDATGTDTANSTVATITQPIATGATATFSFDYDYIGANGNDALVEFMLYTLVGNGELILLQTAQIGCTLTGAENFQDDDGVFNTQPQQPDAPEPCSGTFNVFCWSNMSLGDWVGHLIALTVLLLFTILMLMCFVYFVMNLVDLSKIKRYSKQLAQTEDAARAKARARAGEERGKAI